MEKSQIAKLSLKTIGAQPKATFFDKPEEGAEPELKILGTIFGRANRWDIVPTGFGETVRFIGNFEALTTDKDGKSAAFASTRMFLPVAAANLLRDTLDAQDGAGVDFAFEIAAHWADTDFGYQYVIRPITQMSKADELNALRKAIESDRAKRAPAEKAQADTKPKGANKNA